MKTKLNLIKLCLLWELLFVPAAVQAQFTYTGINGVITITKYTGPGGAVVIPSTTNGYPVVTIADDAFESCNNVTSVTIPNSVINIGNNAFLACNSLANVTIGSGVTAIGETAFSQCPNLTAITVDTNNTAYSSVAGVLFDKDQLTLIQYPGGLAGSYTIPNNVTFIGSYAFSYCSTLTRVTMPQSVIQIGQDAFAACTDLIHVGIDDSVTYIGYAAFTQCPGLTVVTIPSSVTYLGDYAFYQCPGLTSVYFYGNTPSADSTVFQSDNSATVYYLSGATGWSSPFGGAPAVMLTPIAITASPTNGVVPLTVSFTSAGIDSTSRAVTNWNWDFGDGSTSNSQNLSHTYTATGTFFAALLETNSNRNPIAGAVASITISPPAVQFTAVPTNGLVPLTVSFTSAGVDSGGSTITNWYWDFGDGTTSTLQNPTHVYTNVGSFFPNLLAVNNLGITFPGIGPAAITATNEPVYSGLVLNGGFETGDFTAWTLSGDTSYSIVDNGSVSGISPYSGDFEAALGTAGSMGYISQTLVTTAGTGYLLSFWLNNKYGVPGEFSAAWNGNILLNEANPANPGWTNLQFQVVATGTHTLLEFGFEDDDYYLGLDGISVVPMPPSIGRFSLSGTNLIVNGANGLSGATYHLLMSTNLALPLSQWTSVATNTLAGSGNFTINATNAVNLNAPRCFYIIQMQ